MSCLKTIQLYWYTVGLFSYLNELKDLLSFCCVCDVLDVVKKRVIYIFSVHTTNSLIHIMNVF